MRTGKSKVKLTASAVSVLLAGILSTVALAPPSSAATSNSAEIKRSITLASVGGSTTYLPYDKPRSIYLQAGTYDWENTFGQIGEPTLWANRTMVLTAGWYQWSCSLAGTGAAYPDYNYESVCELGSTDPTRYATLPYQGVTVFKLKPGTYDWISWLDFQHA